MRYSLRFISGWTVDSAEKVLNEFYDKDLKNKLNQKIVEKIDYHKKQGSTIIIVTNVFYFLNRLLT